MASLNKFKQNPVKCEICEKEFKSKNSLKNHFNIVHKLLEKHQCNICQKVFSILSQLTKHVKFVHENKKNHKCDSCGKAFPL